MGKKKKKLKKVEKRVVDNRSRWQGDYDTDTHVIRVNKVKSKKQGGRGGVIDTIVHEELHAKHPKAWEKTIDKMTREKLKILTPKQKVTLYSKYDNKDFKPRQKTGKQFGYKKKF